MNSEQTQQIAPKQISRGTDAAYRKLCASISKDATLWSDVELAITQPAAYFERFQAFLVSRGYSSAEQVTPELALTQWLGARGQLIEIGTHSSSSELLAVIRNLPLIAQSGVDLSPLAEEDVNVVHGLIRANYLLTGAHVQFLALGQATTTLTLVLIPFPPINRVLKFAAAAHYPLRKLGANDTLSALESGYLGYANRSIENIGSIATASLWKRFGAFYTDFFVLSFGTVLIASTLTASAQTPDGKNFVVFPAILALLAVSFILMAVVCGKTGATLGKYIWGLRVARHDPHEQPGFARSLLRGTLLTVATLSQLMIVLLISVDFDKAGFRRGLHDRASGTRVIDIRRGFNPITATQPNATP